MHVLSMEPIVNYIVLTKTRMFVLEMDLECGGLYGGIVTVRTTVWSHSCVLHFVAPQRVVIRGPVLAFLTRKWLLTCK